MAKKKTTVPAVDTNITALAEITPIASGTVMKASPESMSLVEQVQAHVILKKMEDALDSRLKELKAPLMAVAEAQGHQDEGSTTKKLQVDGSTITVEHRKSKTPDPEGLKALLASKQVAVSEAFDEVKSLQLNPSKVEYLVQIGKLTRDEVAALCAESTALRIYPSKQLKEAVASLGFEKSAALTE